MRAAYYDDTGDAASVLRTGDIELPAPGPGEIRVRLHASGINPTDVKARAGAPGRAKRFARVIPHHDGAGTVDAVGEGVDADRIGRRVWVFCAQAQRPFGTAAEFVCLPAHLTAPLPDNISFETGAAIGIPTLTAWNAVLGDGPVAGRHVLVAGGAGAVGRYAVQVARRSGAKVIATVSSQEKVQVAREAGAHETVDYRSPDAAGRINELTGGHGVDLLVDVDTTANAALSGSVMAMGGRIASYGSSGLSAHIPVRDLRQRCVSIRFLTIHRFPDDLLAAHAAGINAWLEADLLSHPPLHRFRLDDIVAAHELVEAGQASGKVVVEID